MKNQKLYSTFLLFTLTACSSQYAPLIKPSKNKGGYTEQLITNEANGTKHTNDTAVRYLLTYQGTTSDSKKRITGFWHQRANELCLNGYKVVSHKQNIVLGSIRSPVNGIMVTLGTQQPIDTGIIECL